jgi:aspartyl-tRNA(Asn)/glutamyl-tRNA(Gln) amidotransferase subunit A
MQIAGRPFEDATVLRIAHAYEQATAWHTRRPALAAGDKPAPVVIDSGFSTTPDIDGPTRDLVRMLAERAGLALADPHFEELCHAAPYALAMVQRIRRRRDRFEEPASVFRFPAG